MITAIQCVTDVAKHIHAKMCLPVFKYDDKPTSHKGEYIAVNNLPFVYGKVVNDVNVINVNIHVPKQSNQRNYLKRMDEIMNDIISLFPNTQNIDDCEETCINGVYYSTNIVSRPIEDTDGTYFINVQLKVTFKNIE